MGGKAFAVRGPPPFFDDAGVDERSGIMLGLVAAGAMLAMLRAPARGGVHIRRPGVGMPPCGAEGSEPRLGVCGSAAGAPAGPLGGRKSAEVGRDEEAVPREVDWRGGPRMDAFSRLAWLAGAGAGSWDGRGGARPALGLGGAWKRDCMRPRMNLRVRIWARGGPGT